MGFEDVIPPPPTRDQQLRYINRMEQQFQQQSLTHVYQNEAMRELKIERYEQKKLRRWTNLKNFLIGTAIGSALWVYIHNIQA